MSPHDTAMDYGDAQDERPNAVCSDCDGAFSRAAIDTRTLCDDCCDRRDAWTDALELTMAAAAVGLSVASPSVRQRATFLDSLQTLSAVQASKAGKPIPKKAVPSTQKRRSA